MLEANTVTTAGLNPSARVVKVDVAAFVALKSKHWQKNSAEPGMVRSRSDLFFLLECFNIRSSMPICAAQQKEQMIISASCLLHLELSVRPSAHLGWTGPGRSVRASLRLHRTGGHDVAGSHSHESDGNKQTNP